MVTLSRLALLQQQRQRAAAILRNIDAQIESVKAIAEEAEDVLFDAAERVGRQVLKPLRVSPRQEPVGPPPRTRSLFQRFVLPSLRFLGREFITGSGSFTAQELANAEYTVFFNTEAGFFAEMRFTPTGRPFYSPITREEAAQLRSPGPPPELLARLFTEIEPVDN